jgi:hypothetical protein
MKQTTKTLLTLSALAGLSFTTAQAATVIWDDGDSNESWSNVANWENDGPIPVSGQDSVELTQRSVLNYDFTVADGQSITDTVGSHWFGIANSGWTDGPAHLTLATGGIINVDTLAARGGVTAGSANAASFTIQDGATLNTVSAAVSRPMNLNWVAGASSVTTWNTTNFAAGSTGGDSLLAVDLTNYTIVGASSLTLVNYSGTLTDTFASVTVTDGASTLVNGVDYTLDYTTDTNITLNLIPESGTYALIGGLLSLGYVMVRRRRA